MPTRTLTDILLALLLSFTLAYLMLPFVVEKSFPKSLGRDSVAQVMDKTARNIYGSEKTVIDEVFYVTVQYPVYDGGVEREQVRVKENFYNNVHEGDFFTLAYHFEKTTQLSFKGKEEPMGVFAWMAVLTTCAVPVFFFLITFVRASRKQ